MVRDEQGHYIYGAPIGHFQAVLTSRQERVGEDYRLFILEAETKALLLNIKVKGSMVCLEYVDAEKVSGLHQALENPRGHRGDNWTDYCRILQNAYCPEG